MAALAILDTTLRDGAQGEGVGFSLDDKLKIAQALDALGIAYIEGGNPFSNPKDAQFFKLAPSRMTRAKLAAFGSTMRPGGDPSQDPGLKALVDSQAPVISVFGKGSLFHVTHVLRTTPEENLRMIRESVAFLCQSGREVLFDAEHFFDGWQEDAAYARQCLKAAQEGGAACLILCDTNGGALPDDVVRIVRELQSDFTLPLGIHCHNDCGLAVANTLMAVKAGCQHVQGTIGGVGARCGNGALCTLLPCLQLKMGYNCIPVEAMAKLTPTARYIQEVMNLAPNQRAPFVGHSAFAHKAGMHIDGVIKNTRAFEHLPPEAVGNQRRFLLSEQTGRTGVAARLERLLPDVKKGSPEMDKLLARLKEKEMRGYTYENADASFELLALDTLGRRRRFFEVVDFHVLSALSQNLVHRDKSAQAYIKIQVDGREEINAAEGDGPINALDKALRKTLAVFYPCLNKMRLSDFKVRVLDSGGTASTVRVSIESTDGAHVWSTVGVSSNMIQACMKALSDSVDYLLTNYQP
ncbi:MAG: citramalate synthase [Clostridia bacterium]|nr:citramalate synthase [Clostridia bacterium]